jgi:hypothetical protein
MKADVFAEEILPILKSPDVEGYAVGLTKNVKSRRASYKNNAGWKSLYVIVDNLTQEQSLELEEKYFDYLTQDKRRIFYKKYHPEKRDDNHRASVGGSSPEDDSLYSLYVACY